MQEEAGVSRIWKEVRWRKVPRTGGESSRSRISRGLHLLASSLGSAHPLLAPAQPETRSLLSVIVQQFEPASLQGAPKLADGGQPRVRPADLKGADSLDTDAALL